jgi:hypothetical protein
MERKRWTDKEDAILAQGVKEKCRISSISAKLQYRSGDACRKRIKVLGLDRNEIPDEPPALTSLEKDMMMWQGVKFDDSINALNEKVFANGMDIPSLPYSFVGCAARMVADLGTGEGSYHDNRKPETIEKNRITARERKRAIRKNS